MQKKKSEAQQEMWEAPRRGNGIFQATATCRNTLQHTAKTSIQALKIVCYGTCSMLKKLVSHPVSRGALGSLWATSSGSPHCHREQNKAHAIRTILPYCYTSGDMLGKTCA